MLEVECNDLESHIRLTVLPADGSCGFSFPTFSAPRRTKVFDQPRASALAVCETCRAFVHPVQNSPNHHRRTSGDVERVASLHHRKFDTKARRLRASSFPESRWLGQCGRSRRAKCNSAEARCASRCRLGTYFSVFVKPSTFRRSAFNSSVRNRSRGFLDGGYRSRRRSVFSMSFSNLTIERAKTSRSPFEAQDESGSPTFGTMVFSRMCASD